MSLEGDLREEIEYVVRRVGWVEISSLVYLLQTEFGDPPAQTIGQAIASLCNHGTLRLIPGSQGGVRPGLWLVHPLSSKPRPDNGVDHEREESERVLSTSRGA